MSNPNNIITSAVRVKARLEKQLSASALWIIVSVDRDTAELTNVDYCNAVALPQLSSFFDMPQIIRHALDAFWHDINQKLLMTTQADSLEGFYSDSDSYFDSRRDEEGRVFL